MFLLSTGAAIIMTGYGIIIPVFGRRLETFGAGVEELGLMAMGFAIAQFALAPLVGSIADRIGRRPLILVAFGGFALVNLGFLFAQNPAALMALRVFEGAVTAGLMPSAMGVIGDIVPLAGRARWSGVLMGSYGLGFTLGPFAGGVLYDNWGYAAPFIVSSVLSLVAFIIALALLPETHSFRTRQRVRLAERREAVKESIVGSLPRPLWVFGSLLFMDFVLLFSFSFVEPEMVFYAYEQLDLTTTQFGLIIMCYGCALVAGQFGLSGLSDRFGRRTVIVSGLVIMTVFYIGFLVSTNYPILLLVSIISGLGEAIAMPALAAVYLDMTNERHRSRVMGLRSSATSLAAVAGPALIAAIAGITTTHQVFAISLGVGLAAALLAIFALKRRARSVSTPAPDDTERSKSAASILDKLAGHTRITGAD
jgi:MFS family permease